jgi:hypothetical protein
MLLSLPIPANMSIDISFTAVPRMKGQFLRYGLTISKFETLGKLISEIENLAGISANKLLLATVYANKVHTMYNSATTSLLFHLGIRSGDTLFAYEAHRTVEDAESDGRLLNKPIA